MPAIRRSGPGFGFGFIFHLPSIATVANSISTRIKRYATTFTEKMPAPWARSKTKAKEQATKTTTTTSSSSSPPPQERDHYTTYPSIQDFFDTKRQHLLIAAGPDSWFAGRIVPGSHGKLVHPAPPNVPRPLWTEAERMERKEKLKRKCKGRKLDPQYCLRRYQLETMWKAPKPVGEELLAERDRAMKRILDQGTLRSYGLYVHGTREGASGRRRREGGRRRHQPDGHISNTGTKKRAREEVKEARQKRARIEDEEDRETKKRPRGDDEEDTKETKKRVRVEDDGANNKKRAREEDDEDTEDERRPTKRLKM
ncbi:hypothetical protein HRR83_005369 [Exophiala dermatitidis]|uniref:Uncharacterized protein n=1 Tax=Exophiala dermatitidis TaxID=5970 RepID=A0AAN6EUL6_EXODE|nr:hypothetical protein HRR75_004786 [Exophiala dermatitidis]KAJ4516065.1 hypothetical protein HRR74_005222 [Exophiala dermatitidis]KAJ4518530.1 hypothetical protein HRR73_004111 [Exophiala dermatitidis]KAJ4534030.1 hypothetical protein HRR76_005976 [Exophiala dermatitidis]KAJ4550186.1 hypothetical protein HRR77_003662 [Exophiala dermatitidis]